MGTDLARGKKMNNMILIMGLAAALAALPFAATAAIPEDEDCDIVEQLVKDKTPPQTIIKTMVGGGMSLEEGAVFAMVCGGEVNRVPIAVAGVEAAANLVQANGVAAALVATAGETSPVATAVRNALKQYEKTAKQPPVYKTDYKPTGGGGVSPSS